MFTKYDSLIIIFITLIIGLYWSFCLIKESIFININWKSVALLLPLSGYFILNYKNKSLSFYTVFIIIVLWVLNNITIDSVGFLIGDNIVVYSVMALTVLFLLKIRLILTIAVLLFSTILIIWLYTNSQVSIILILISIIIFILFIKHLSSDSNISKYRTLYLEDEVRLKKENDDEPLPEPDHGGEPLPKSNGGSEPIPQYIDGYEPLPRQNETGAIILREKFHGMFSALKNIMKKFSKLLLKFINDYFWPIIFLILLFCFSVVFINMRIELSHKCLTYLLVSVFPWVIIIITYLCLAPKKMEVPMLSMYINHFISLRNTTLWALFYFFLNGLISSILEIKFYPIITILTSIFILLSQLLFARYLLIKMTEKSIVLINKIYDNDNFTDERLYNLNDHLSKEIKSEHSQLRIIIKSIINLSEILKPNDDDILNIEIINDATNNTVESIKSWYSPLHALIWSIPALGFLGTAWHMRNAMMKLSEVQLSGKTFDVELIRLITPDLSISFLIICMALGITVIFYLATAIILSTENDLLVSTKNLIMNILCAKV